MKHASLAVVLFAFLLSPVGLVLAAEDIRQAPSCLHCGMDREAFSHSRMLVTYDDGTGAGTCSIHCLAIELAVNIDKTPASIMVGDFGSKKLIDAEQAFWVIGGKKPGVMSRQAKWAFAEKEAAEAFIKENGGAPATFDEAMKAAYESMHADLKMIRERRQMKKMKGHGH